MKQLRLTLLWLSWALLSFTPDAGAQPSASILASRWEAYWIDLPGTNASDAGVYLFRKVIDLTAAPTRFIVHVSADNRYKLFVNGRLVSLGPARGDILHWRFETVDLATDLRPGRNLLSAIVWNDADLRPEAQVSYRTGFILQGNSPSEEIANTNSSWKCTRDEACGRMKANVLGYYAASSGECVDMRKHPRGWQEILYDDKGWMNAREIFHGTPKGVFTYDPGWMLIPSPLPPMELKEERIPRVRSAEGVAVPARFTSGNSPIVIPPNTKAKILLDQTRLTDDYPTIIFSGGQGGSISLRYAEALYTARQGIPSSETRYDKSQRDDVSGKVFIGLEDSVVSDGSASQTFTSRWWRAYRYIELVAKTTTDSMSIDDLYGTRTGYPFTRNATFSSSDTTLAKILDVGWRTARLCAFETYMDCPYYEELQYVGDTRIQALVSYYNSGDSRLARNALELIDNSRNPDGLTQSRYPTATTQYIPPFSLLWIGMLYDYWRYTPDSEFVRAKLAGAEAILSFFGRYQEADGSLRNVPYWNFADWIDAPGWKDGMAPVGPDGSSSILDLELLQAYEQGAEIEARLGSDIQAEGFSKQVERLKNTIIEKYWDRGRREFADTQEKRTFSQHANALVILSGVLKGEEAHDLGRMILTDSSLTEATIYFKYYVNRALALAGFGDEYLHLLGIWKENLRYGMTTWGETSDLSQTRSDCHAWGASPNIELFRTVLGVESDAPGFARVQISPHLGTLTFANGEIPHPQGKIRVNYSQGEKGWTVTVTIPEKITGLLLWGKKTYTLKGGENRFLL
ncbi:MAG TPA: alpha-L-rhamnosidase C-terminal domain-containing protein [Bacteroidota bacterium]|nr:alpha-L-rhamnosidase C-terminal domain-containing protein [Bacteroidota bacterium]